MIGSMYGILIFKEITGKKNLIILGKLVKYF
jgi:hypothetical protein